MILAPLLLLVFAQPAAAPGPLRAESLAGVVVDSSGKAVTGADVWISSGLSPSDERPLIGGVLWMQSSRAFAGGSPEALGHTRTDQDGHFQIELPAEIVRSQEPLSVAVWVYASGARVASRRLAWAIPAPVEPIRLVLQSARDGGISSCRARWIAPGGGPRLRGRARACRRPA